MQIMMPKLTEIASAHGNEGSRQILATQHGADRAREMVDSEMREVRAKQDVQAVNMRTDKERDANGQSGRRNRRGRGASQGDGKRGAVSHIDIKL